MLRCSISLPPYPAQFLNQSKPYVTVLSSWHPIAPYSIDAHTALTPPVYQKVVPAPVFALLIELTTLGPETEGAAALAPAPAAASLADIDDAEAEGSGSPAGAGGSASGLSGNEWERVSDEGVRA
jgi:hypothetical protein